MKKTLTKILSVVLIVVITLTSVPLSGFVVLELPEWLNFSTIAKAFDDLSVDDDWGGDLGIGGDFDDGWGGVEEEPEFFERETYLGDNVFQFRIYGSNVVFLYGSGEILDNYATFGSSITKAILDSRITSIGENTFSSCYNLTDIYYSGTEEQWNQIVIGDNNEYLYNANIHYDSEMPAGQFEAGAYWFFDESVGTLALRGEGGTDDYEQYGTRPWDEYRYDILCVDAGFFTMGYIGDYAFSNLYYLEEVQYPECVAWYGKGTFLGCENLNRIDIGAFTSEIGDEAFAYCINLSSVSIAYDEYSMLTIGNSVFRGCSNLRNLTLPESVSITIDEDAFFGCYSLESITIPNSVTAIGASAFSGCNSLKSIIIPDSVKTIGEYAFFDCTSLENIIIPDSVTAIGKYAFRDTAYYCDEANWENDVLYINNHLIGAHSSLEGEYIIRNGILTISGYAFYDCCYVTTIEIPESVVSIGDCAFLGCSGLINFEVDNNNKYFFSDEYGVLFDKNKTDLLQYPTANTRKKYIIPDGVNTIDSYAFADCYSLTDIIIPNSLTTICDFSFNDCYSLTNITIPDSVTSIGYSAFSGCTDLTNVIIGNGVVSIEYYAFEDCENLEYVMIGTAVKQIKANVFSNCSKIVGIYVNSNNQYYSSDEYGTLFNKDKTELIHYPAGNIRTNYVIPDGVTTISNSAFLGSSNLINITIPDSVTSIGDASFASCTGLTSIIIPASVTSIGNTVFSNCTNLLSVIIPSGIRTIGDAMFSHCSNLISVTLPDTVRTIGKSAFSWCTRLKSIKIPSYVISIGDEAFSTCLSLTDVYFYSTDEQWKQIEIGTWNTNLTESTIHYEHSHRSEPVTISSTCVTKGYNINVCSLCGYSYIVSEFAPQGHNYVNGICLNCGDSHTSGLCGKNISWTYTPSNSTLTIYGTDEMADSLLESSYWFDFKDDIKKIVIEDGVTLISEFAFYGCNNLEEITIPSSVINIKNNAFYYCSSLNEVNYSSTKENWNAILLGSNNEALLDATLNCLSSGGDITGGDFGTDFVEHSYTFEITMSPTCQETGIMTYICENCGNSYMEVIPATGHNYEIVATDSQNGLSKYACTICNQESLVLIDSLNCVEGLTYKANTVKDVLLVLNEEDSAYKIFDADGTELSENDLVGTGAKIYIYDANTDELLNAYTVVLYGDVNGDGLINEVDQKIITDVATCKSTIDNQWFLMAADTNHDGAVDAFDVIETDLQSLDMHNIEQKNNSAYLPKDEEDQSKPTIDENDPDGDGWWG